MTFEEARRKLAEVSGGAYRVIEYSITESERGGEQKCSLYIHGREWCHGPTWEAAFSKLAGSPPDPCAFPGEEMEVE